MSIQRHLWTFSEMWKKRLVHQIIPLTGIMSFSMRQEIICIHRFLSILMLAGSVLIAGCSSSKTLDTKDDSDGGRQCIEPENPYSEGTGHYAGYEWAQKNSSGNCNGSSQSFDEGCEEYETQESEYDECEALKKK
jgi:hypothetical protein